MGTNGFRESHNIAIQKLIETLEELISSDASNLDKNKNDCIKTLQMVNFDVAYNQSKKADILSDIELYSKYPGILKSTIGMHINSLKRHL